MQNQPHHSRSGFLLLLGLIAAALGFRLADWSYDPLQTTELHPKTWFLQLSFESAAIKTNRSLITTPLEREISRLPGVKKSVAITYPSQSVVAFLTSADTNADEIESDVNFLVNKIQSQQKGDSVSFMLFNKPVHIPLEGVVPIDKRYLMGLDDELVFQNEITQLFGNRPRFKPETGFLPLLRPNLSLSLRDMESQSVSRRLLELVADTISAELDKISGIQLMFVRNLPQRVLDLSVSGVDLLRHGLTINDVKQAIQGGFRRPIPTELQKAQERLPATSDIASQSLSSQLLETVLKSEGPQTTRLQDVAEVRPGYVSVSALLGRRMQTTWTAQTISATTLRRPQASHFTLPPVAANESSDNFTEQEADAFHLRLLSDSLSDNESIQRAIVTKLGALQRDHAYLGFSIANHNTERNERTKNQLWNLSLLAASFLMLAFALPVRILGVVFLRNCSFALAIYTCFAWMTLLHLSLERVATALGLIFIYGLSTQLPLAKNRFLKTSKMIHSERTHLFVLLLVVPMLFSIFLFAPELSLGERQHLTSFCLGAIAVTLTGFTLRVKAPKPKSLIYPEEVESRANLLKGLVCILPIFVPLFESEIFSTKPPGLATFGTIQLQGVPTSPMDPDSEQPQFRSPQEVLARIRSLRSLGMQSLHIASPENGREVQLLGSKSEDAALDAEVISEFSSGLETQLLHLGALSESAEQITLVRLGDSDHSRLEKPVSPGGAQVLTSMKDWIRSAQAPRGSLLSQETSNRASAEASKRVHLGAYLQSQLSLGASKHIQEGGKPVLLFSSFGPIDGPTKTEARAASIRSRLYKSMEESGLPPESIQLRSNFSEHQTKAKDSLKLNAIFAVLVFFAGALFFGSLRGAIQTFGTFLLAYGVAKPILIFVYTFSGTLFAVTELELQFAALSLCIALLTVWGHMSADANESRKGNLTLQKALIPFFNEASYLNRSVFVLWSLTMIVSLSFHSFRFVAGLLLAAYIALYLFPGWVYLWAKAEEQYHRRILRISVWFESRQSRARAGTTLLSILAVSVPLLFPSRAEASETVDTSCDESNFAVLPFLNRPMSVEKPRVDIQITEILTSQLPCAVTLHALTPQMSRIMEQNRGPENFRAAAEALQRFAASSRDMISESYISARKTATSPNKLTLVMGFVEEQFGHTGIAILTVHEDSEGKLHKSTVRTHDRVDFLKRVARNLRKDDRTLISDLDRQKDLIPVRIAPVSSRQFAKNSRNNQLKHEIQNFITNRFENPLPPAFLERKRFFRLAQPGEEAEHKLQLTFESDESRLFGSVKASLGQKERSVWVESDLTNLQEFEDELLRGSRSALASLEGIRDYSVTLGPAVLRTVNGTATLVSGMLRQNRGTLAFSGRFRVGNTDGFRENQKTKHTLILGGVAAGFQAIDLRWFSLDSGLALDGGLSQSDSIEGTDQENTEPSLLVSPGIYVQTLVDTSVGVYWQTRLGLELPYETPLGDTGVEAGVLPSFPEFYTGIGFAF